jgi:PAS domain S-box-containing protein
MRRNDPSLNRGTSCISSAVKISLGYLLFGVLWILLSDAIAASLAGSQKQLHFISSVKGWVFVGVTAAMFFVILRHNARKIRAQQQWLIEREHHLQLAQSTARIGSWEQDGRSGALRWSDMAYELFGFDPFSVRISFELFMEVVHPADRQRVRQDFEKSCVPGAPPYNLVHRIIRADSGEVRLVHERCAHERDAAGNIVRSTGTVQDVTELKQQEAELNENRKLLRDVLDAIPDLIWMKGPDGVYLLSNQQFASHVNKPNEAIRGKRDCDLFPPDQADSFRINDRAAVEQKRTVANEEWVHNDTDGHSFWLETLKTPVYDDQGDLMGVLGIGRDISHRKVALQQSEERKAFLDTVLEGSPVPMWIGDVSGTVLRANQSLYRMLGLRPEQIVGKYNVLRDCNLKSPEIVAQLDGLLSHKKPAHFEVLWKSSEVQEVDGAEGRDLYLDVSIYPLLDAEGEISHIVCQWVDLTERRAALEALKRSEQEFRTLADTLPLAIYLSRGPEQACEYLNPAFTELFGYTMEEVPSLKAWWPLAYPDPDYGDAIATEWICRISNALKGKEAVAPLEAIVTCKDGSTKTILWGYAVIGEKGYSYGLDLTELRKAETQFETLALHAPAGIYMTDAEGRYLYTNPSWLEMAGMTLEQAQGVGWLAALHPDDREFVFEAWRRDRAARGEWNVEYRFRTPAGKITWVHGIATELHDHLGRVSGYIGINNDITDRKRIEEELAGHHAQLEREVQERTSELRRMVNVMAGRENRMAEIKRTNTVLRTQIKNAGMTPAEGVAPSPENI